MVLQTDHPEFCAQEVEILCSRTGIPCSKMEILHSRNGKFPQCHRKSYFLRKIGQSCTAILKSKFNDNFFFRDHRILEGVIHTVIIMGCHRILTLTLVTLKGQCQGHSDFKDFYLDLVKEPRYAIMVLLNGDGKPYMGA